MSDHQTLSLLDGMRQTRVTYSELWAFYVALGGDGTVDQLQDHVESQHCPDDHDHKVIAPALNDLYVDSGRDHPVAYRHLDRPGPIEQ